MRIAINTRLLVHNKMDGIGWFTYETTRRMIAAHPEHTFYLFFDRRPDSHFQFADNAILVSLCPPARHPVLWWTYFEVSVRMALKRYRIDLFLSPDGFLPLRCSIPTVAVMHDLNFEHYPDNLRLSHQRYMKHFFPLFAQQATRLATVSHYSKSDLVATYKVDPARVDVVCNGASAHYRPHTADEQASVRQRFTGGAPFLLFVSTILRRKNLAHLLLAFDRIRSMESTDLKLIVVGKKAWWADELAEAYSSMQHASDVIFLGHLPQQELAALMSAAQALVYPSYFEGFGIPILEAMYAETAVICSKTTSMPEVAGDAALYVDPTDTASITHAISQIASPSLRLSLIEKGRQQRTKFSWDIAANTLWDCMMKASLNP